MIRIIAALTLLPLLSSLGFGQSSCPGCVDSSPQLADTGPVTFSRLNDGYYAHWRVTTIVTPNSGICTLQRMDPPFSHIVCCEQAVPCTPRVEIGLLWSLSPNTSVSFEIDAQQICSATVTGSGRVPAGGGIVNEGAAVLYSQRVRNTCGTDACPVSVEINFESKDSKDQAQNGLRPADESTIVVSGFLSCSDCDGCDCGGDGSGNGNGDTGDGGGGDHDGDGGGCGDGGGDGNDH